MDVVRGKKVNCYKCSNQLSFESGDKIQRLEECSQCQVYLHCCRMCAFYDPTAYNECREPNAERILEKEKANYCTYFILSSDGNNNGTSKDDAISAANALFKD